MNETQILNGQISEMRIRYSTLEEIRNSIIEKMGAIENAFSKANARLAELAKASEAVPEQPKSEEKKENEK